MKKNLWQRAALIPALLLAFALLACRQEAPPLPEPTEPPTATSTGSVQEEAEPAPVLLFQAEFADERVYSVAFSPDGSLVAGGSSMEARLWRADDGQFVRAIEYRHSVDDLAFSPDGAALGAGQGVYGVQLMQVADGEELRQLHGGYNNYLAFSPDGETVATGNRNGVVWLWRVADGEQLAEFEPPINEWITSLAFSPDGEILAAGHWDGTVFLWRVSDGQLLHMLEKQTDFCRANGLAFSPDGEWLAVAGGRQEWQDVVRLYQVAAGSIHLELPMSREAKDVAYSPDGRWLAAGSQDELCLWEMPSGTLWHSLDHVAHHPADESDWITSLAFSPDSTLLAAGRWAGILEVWQLTP
jgi:WD40 repeat protein